jgi:lysophospholipase L1-like esterase
MAEARRSGRVAHIAKVVLFSLAPAIVLLIVAETIAILSIAREGRITVDSTTGRRVYTMRVGKWPWSRRTVTPLNSLGFPDEEFPIATATKTCTHVVFAGDSYIFGDGVDRDSNFVEIIRRRVADRPNAGCVRIFSLGERGTTIDRQARRLLETMDRLQPDVVILGQYQNDLTDLTSPGAILGPPPPAPGATRSGRIQVPLPAFNVSFLKMLAYRSMAVMIRRGIRRDELRHWSVIADSSRKAEAIRLQETYERQYDQLVDTLKRRRVAFGVIIIPSKLDILAARYPEEPFFMSLAQRHAVPYLRIFPILNANRSPYAFLVYDGHLNEQGNRLVASAVLSWLFETEPAPFPVLRRSPP